MFHVNCTPQNLIDEAEETDSALKDAGRVCFFCDNAEKICECRKMLAQYLPIYNSMKVTFFDDITQNAHGIEDKITLEKINSLAADAIIYGNNSCKTLYFFKCINKPITVETDSQKYIHFHEVITFIKEEVIKLKKKLFEVYN